jgi:hypothetical protein
MRTVLIRLKPYRSRRKQPFALRRTLKWAVYALVFAVGFVIGPLLVRQAAKPPVLRTVARRVTTAPGPGHTRRATFVPPLATRQHMSEAENLRASPVVVRRAAAQTAPSRSTVSLAKGPRSGHRPAAGRPSQPLRPDVTLVRESQSRAARVQQPASPPPLQTQGPLVSNPGPIPAAPSDSTGRSTVSRPQPVSSPSSPGSSSRGAPEDVPAVRAESGAPGPIVRYQGDLIAVDVKRLRFSISGNGGSTTREFQATSETTIAVGSQAVAFSRLREFVGSLVTVWSTQLDTRQVAGRVLLTSAAKVVSRTAADHGSQNATLPDSASVGSTGSSGSAGSGGSGSGSSGSGNGGGGGSGSTGGGGLGGIGGAIEHGLESIGVP